MNYRKTKWIWLLALSVMIFSACSPRARYERMMKKELTSTERHDSIFMGIYLGMTSKDFYLRCWDLNRQGLIRQGSSNTNVEYQMKKELPHPAVMNFYPHFADDKIYEMPVRYKYVGWAPWNKELSSSKLKKEILKLYEKKYGRGFIRIEHPMRGNAYVKIDGNRRITIFTSDDLYVWVYFNDLKVSNDLITRPDSTLNDSITE
jgi:hypothetical protein